MIAVLNQLVSIESNVALDNLMQHKSNVSVTRPNSLNIGKCEPLGCDL